MCWVASIVEYCYFGRFVSTMFEWLLRAKIESNYYILVTYHKKIHHILRGKWTHPHESTVWINGASLLNNKHTHTFFTQQLNSTEGFPLIYEFKILMCVLSGPLSVGRGRIDGTACNWHWHSFTSTFIITSSASILGTLGTSFPDLVWYPFQT